MQCTCNTDLAKTRNLAHSTKSNPSPHVDTDPPGLIFQPPQKRELVITAHIYLIAPLIGYSVGRPALSPSKTDLEYLLQLPLFGGCRSTRCSQKLNVCYTGYDWRSPKRVDFP